MKTERFAIWEDGEYSYSRSFGFVPGLTTYIHDEDQRLRPCLLVVPGGGYFFVSPREGEIIARRFYDFGVNAFVLTYTVNPLQDVPLQDQPLRDLTRAIRVVRKRAAEFHIDPDRITLCGFSAGGHLCASACVHWEDVKDEKYGDVSARPDAAILSYPVISSGEYAHRGSFDALLGKDAPADALHYWSLETQVKADTPPCFLWHTATDESVPVENSEMFAHALRAHGVPYAMHVFSEGHHGLSLANEDWVEGRFCAPYTMEQNDRAVRAVRGGEVPMTEWAKVMLSYFDADAAADRPKEKTVPEVTVWPELAWAWMNKQGMGMKA